MKKYSFLCLLALIIFAWSCGDGQKTQDTTSTDTTENTAEENTDNPQDATTPKGDAAYEVVVLKDDIPSPKKEMKATMGETSVSVIYGSPSIKGRTVWGELVPFGKVWRTGANEATSIEFSSDVMVAGEKLPAGKYGLFTIPNEDKWTIIFNEVATQWGAYEYDASKDVLRVEVAPRAEKNSSETMEFMVEGNSIVLMWGELAVPIEVKS